LKLALAERSSLYPASGGLSRNVFILGEVPARPCIGSRLPMVTRESGEEIGNFLGIDEVGDERLGAVGLRLLPGGEDAFIGDEGGDVSAAAGAMRGDEEGGVEAEAAHLGKFGIVSPGDAAEFFAGIAAGPFHGGFVFVHIAKAFAAVIKIESDRGKIVEDAALGDEETFGDAGGGDVPDGAAGKDFVGYFLEGLVFAFANMSAGARAGPGVGVVGVDEGGVAEVEFEDDGIFDVEMGGFLGVEDGFDIDGIELIDGGGFDAIDGPGAGAGFLIGGDARRVGDGFFGGDVEFDDAGELVKATAFDGDDVGAVDAELFLGEAFYFFPGVVEGVGAEDGEFEAAIAGAGAGAGVAEVAVAAADKDGAVFILDNISAAEPEAGGVLLGGDEDAGLLLVDDGGGEVVEAAGDI
jgi:hypothetical protein